jgi:hypothetical protein
MSCNDQLKRNSLEDCSFQFSILEIVCFKITFTILSALEVLRSFWPITVVTMDRSTTRQADDIAEGTDPQHIKNFVRDRFDLKKNICFAE